MKIISQMFALISASCLVINIQRSDYVTMTLNVIGIILCSAMVIWGEE